MAFEIFVCLCNRRLVAQTAPPASKQANAMGGYVTEAKDCSCSPFTLCLCFSLVSISLGLFMCMCVDVFVYCLSVSFSFSLLAARNSSRAPL